MLLIFSLLSKVFNLEIPSSLHPRDSPTLMNDIRLYRPRTRAVRLTLAMTLPCIRTNRCNPHTHQAEFVKCHLLNVPLGLSVVALKINGIGFSCLMLRSRNHVEFKNLEGMWVQEECYSENIQGKTRNNTRSKGETMHPRSRHVIYKRPSSMFSSQLIPRP